jgi:hypothetical protein
MSRMRNRWAILLAAIAIVAVMLACSAGTLVSRVEPTATPTKTPKPTFTITPTPTDTPIPTDTPLPTNTPTPTDTPEPPTPTCTPEPPTDTPEPTPTDTPLPPPTNTPRPTPRPTQRPAPTATPRPQPVNTPMPSFEFSAIRLAQFDTANCGSTGVKGTIYSRTGGRVAGAHVAVWVPGWEGTVSEPSDSNGAWDVLLDFVPKAGTWNVRLVDPASCQPKAGGGSTPSANCTGWRSDMVTVNTTANCEGAGAVQWPVVDFKQN